eukprot:286005-Pyramimonas_sp.AAC.1
MSQTFVARTYRFVHAWQGPPTSERLPRYDVPQSSVPTTSAYGGRLQCFGIRLFDYEMGMVIVTVKYRINTFKSDP